MQVVQPELDRLEALFTVRRNPADVAKPLVEGGCGRSVVDLVVPEAGQLGPCRQSRLVPANRLLGEPAFGDVHRDTGQALRPAVGRCTGSPEGGDPALHAVILQPDPVLHAQWLPPMQRPVDGGANPLPVVRMDRGLEALHGESLVGRVPEELPSSIRRPEDARADIQGPEPGVGGVRRKAHARLGLAQPGDHLLPLERTDEHHAEHAETCDEGVGPLALVMHGVEQDQVQRAAPGLDRERQGRPDRHQLPPGSLGVRLGREVGHLLDANRRALHEQRLA